MMRRYAAAILAANLLFGCTSQSSYEGPPSTHFDGERFFNELSADKSIADIAVFASTYWIRRESWPKWVKNAAYPEAQPPAAGWVATYINHSTVLLQSADATILTDPIWAERASPFSFIGPRRVRHAGMRIVDLPPLDAIVISHDHYDHLDIEALLALRNHGRAGPPLVLVGLGNGALLAQHGISNYRELDWDETVTIGNTEIAFVEVRHRSGRGLRDQMSTLWGGFVMRNQSGQIYFAGDTGYGPHFQRARERYGAFDLSLLPIGAYRPRSFMAPVHLDPAGAVQAHLDLDSQQSIAIHHGTFQLTYEPIEEPYRELNKALDSARLDAAKFRVLGFGESIHINENRF